MFEELAKLRIAELRETIEYHSQRYTMRMLRKSRTMSLTH